MKSQNFKTGLSDCHKLFCKSLRASFKTFPHKIVQYKDQKHFDQKMFHHDLDSKDRHRNCNDPYEKSLKLLLVF